MRLDLRLVLWVMVGGAIGSAARFAISVGMQQRSATSFPTATLMINVVGSFLLGLIMQFSLATTTISPEVRLLLTTGFCGGFTTFSTFSYESISLIRAGEFSRAAAYVGSSVVLCLGATLIGIAAAQRMVRALRGN